MSKELVIGLIACVVLAAVVQQLAVKRGAALGLSKEAVLVLIALAGAALAGRRLQIERMRV